MASLVFNETANDTAKRHPIFRCVRRIRNPGSFASFGLGRLVVVVVVDSRPETSLSCSDPRACDSLLEIDAPERD